MITNSCFDDECDQNGLDEGGKGLVQAWRVEDRVNNLSRKVNESNGFTNLLVLGS